MISASKRGSKVTALEWSWLSADRGAGMLAAEAGARKLPSTPAEEPAAGLASCCQAWRALVAALHK